MSFLRAPRVAALRHDLRISGTCSEADTLAARSVMSVPARRIAA